MFAKKNGFFYYLIKRLIKLLFYAFNWKPEKIKYTTQNFRGGGWKKKKNNIL